MEHIIAMDYIETRVRKIDIFLRYHHMMAQRADSPGLEKWHKQELYACLRSRYEIEMLAHQLGINVEQVSNKYDYANTENSTGYRTLQSDD